MHFVSMLMGFLKTSPTGTCGLEVAYPESSSLLGDTLTDFDFSGEFCNFSCSKFRLRLILSTDFLPTVSVFSGEYFFPDLVRLHSISSLFGLFLCNFCLFVNFSGEITFPERKTLSPISDAVCLFLIGFDFTGLAFLVLSEITKKNRLLTFVIVIDEFFLKKITF